MRTRFVGGNWKMFTTSATARQLAKSLAKEVGDETRVAIAVFPPYPYLGVIHDALEGTKIVLGGQNCFFEKEGPYTGEVSPTMLLDVGCQAVILGHSERRHKLGETDAFVNRKVHAALSAGLRVVLCVGETLEQRKADKTEEVLRTQLAGSLHAIPRDLFPRIVLTYEPIWAIGTGQNATPQQAQHAHSFIRGKIAESFGEEIARRLLISYGGSVKPENAASLVSQPDVDGALVGGASLDAEQFLGIIRAAIEAPYLNA